MDSVTQATLGASVAHLCWHKNLGRKSFVYGAVFGTLPDLDVILYPFLNGVQRLYWHRGESHSIFFIILASLLFLWLFKKKAKDYDLSPIRLYTGFFLILLTHILIDYFTVYGTQLLAPLSKYGFARGNFFIIDPLYTAPLIIGILASLFLKADKRFKANSTGVVISCIYTVFALLSHSYADNIFKNKLKTDNVKVIDSITSATPMNTLLWRHITRTEKGILIGYYSVIGKNGKDEIRFDFVDQNKELLKDIENQANVEAVKWFSKGFFVAQKKNNVLRMSDLRFGELRPYENAKPDTWQYVFTWELDDGPDELTSIRSKDVRFDDLFAQLVTRIKN
jgi:inner membrane protein